MPSLARLLLQEFSRSLPTGWRARPEAAVVEDQRLLHRLGYEPRADLLLERSDRTRRIWIEFEISRADPVANHAKFATAHLFQPFGSQETFVAMVSPHIVRGRRNLASNAVELMRRVGMDAFQMPLLPLIPPDEIKRLNHLPWERLKKTALDVRRELEHLFAVVEPAIYDATYRIHFAPDVFDVMLNIDAWNQEIPTHQGASLWNRRTVRYFAYDASTGNFAPSKFCAFVPVTVGAGRPLRIMTMRLYAALDESEPRFDGHWARTHLEQRLGMKLVQRRENERLDAAFDDWHARMRHAVSLHHRGPSYLIPPDWF